MDENRRITISSSFKYLLCRKVTTEDSSEEIFFRQRVSILLAVHAIAITQATGYFVHITAFPYLTTSLNISSEMFGVLISMKAFVQLMGGPMSGRIADVFGARFTLILSFVAICISYTIIAAATNLVWLLLSRIPMFFAHALQCKYMIISEVTYQEERADHLGKIGVSHGLGMVIGSVLGGFVAEVLGIRVALVTALLFAIVCLILSIFCIPKNTQQIQEQIRERAGSTDNSQDNYTDSILPETASLVGIKEIFEVLRIPHMSYYLFLKFIASFPVGILGTVFSLVFLEHYHLTPKENGIVLAYLGVLGILSQGVLIGMLTEYYTDDVLITFGIILLAISFLFFIISKQIYLFCLAAVPFILGGSIIHVLITAIVTKLVPQSLLGTALGVTVCIHAVIRTVSPTIGGFLLGRIGFYSFGIQGYIVNLLLLVYLCFIEDHYLE